MWELIEEYAKHTIDERLAVVNDTIKEMEAAVRKPEILLAYQYGFRDAINGKRAATDNPDYGIGYGDGLLFLKAKQ
jgi:hypothetical protein